MSKQHHVCLLFAAFLQVWVGVAIAKPTQAPLARPNAVHGNTAELQFGKPIHFHNISLIPVTTNRKGPFQRYTLFEQGVRSKTFDVRELKGNSGDAQVNEVEVRNRGKHPVYLLGGEMILGGKQDRIIGQDTVIAPTRRWSKVSVFCIEQGRWQGQEMKFRSGGAMADFSIQKAALKGSQSDVWNEVSKKNVRHGTQSNTQTYRRTIQNEKLRKQIRPHVRRLTAKLPKDGQLAGVVLGINGKIHVADLFGNPTLFRELQPKLLTAYVLEALSHDVDKKAVPVSRNRAKGFVSKGRKMKQKTTKRSGRAINHKKEDKELIGSETEDSDTGEKVRETYIGK